MILAYFIEMCERFFVKAQPLSPTGISLAENTYGSHELNDAKLGLQRKVWRWTGWPYINQFSCIINCRLSMCKTYRSVEVDTI